MPDLNTLNNLDWIILFIMLWSVGWAGWNGFSKEVFSLLGLIAAFIITVFGGDALNGMMDSMLPDNAVARMVSKLIVFLLCIIILNKIAGIGAGALRKMLSRPVDVSLGILFGFIRASLLVLLPYLLVNLHIDPKIYPDWLTQARSYQFLEGGANLLRQVMPDHAIRDDARTDLKPMEKLMDEEGKLDEVLDETDNSKQDLEKKEGETPDSEEKTNQKDKDSAGISKAKELFKVLRESMGQ